MAVESTMSVTTIVARTRSLSDSSGSSQPRTPLHSIETAGSSPTTHASWPGATSITLFGPSSNSSPPSVTMSIVPLTITPRCRVWHHSPPTSGRM
jgi:hypothetical protein